MGLLFRDSDRKERLNKPSSVKVPTAIESTPSLRPLPQMPSSSLVRPLPQMASSLYKYSNLHLPLLYLEQRSSRGLEVIESLPSGSTGSRYCISPEHGTGLFSVIQTVSCGEVSKLIFLKGPSFSYFTRVSSTLVYCLAVGFSAWWAYLPLEIVDVYSSILWSCLDPVSVEIAQPRIDLQREINQFCFEQLISSTSALGQPQPIPSPRTDLPFNPLPEMKVKMEVLTSSSGPSRAMTILSIRCKPSK